MVSTMAKEFTIDDEMVKTVAFRHVNGLSDELVELLSDDEHIVPFYSATKALAAKVQAQLTDYNRRKALGMHVDAEWRRRTSAISGRCNALLAEYAPLVKERNRRQDQDECREKLYQLQRAVTVHRTEVNGEFDPTPADLDLWNALDKVKGT